VIRYGQKMIKEYALIIFGAVVAAGEHATPEEAIL
jgi:hypothetical protein